MKSYNTFWLLAIWTILVTACAEKDELQSVKGTPVEVICSLQIACIGGEESTRATDLTTEESTIQDLTVIQFDGTDDNAPSMIVRTFQNPSSLKDFKIGLMQPQNKDKQQTLYFIANAGKTFSSFNGTLGAFKATTVSSSDMGGKILMTGSCQTVIKTETGVNATLSSRLAKIVFKINNQLSNARFEPIWLQLKSVPVIACPEAPASGTIYPANDNSSLYTDLEPVTSDIGDSCTWYIPENRRGTSRQTVSDPKNKNSHTPDSYCTCIYLEANYYPNADNTGAKRVYYTLYPGNDNTNDFNIEGNQPYNVTLNITKMPDDNSDSRLKVEPIPASRPGANCYMVQPNSSLTFNPHSIPGDSVLNTISYYGRVGTGIDGDCNIHHVGLVWQTDPELIQAIYHLKANGEVRIQTGEMQGNALIAAYDTNKNILWSWHIWVTDYVLDDVGDTMVENSADVPGGHVYKWSNQIWMDRGIGAKKAGLGVDAFGMCYQWGRKDPFLPAIQNTESGNSSPEYENKATAQTVPMYNSNGERVYVGGQKITNSANDFDRPMNNPTLFYSSTSSLWYGSTQNNNLWQDNVKTCFDPCPAGWRVAPSSVQTSFTANNITFVYNTTVQNMESNGATCKAITGLRWPYGGYRDISNGKSKGPGHEGLFWTSSSSDGKGSIYGGKGNGADATARAQSDGQSARCVKIITTN